MSEELRCGCGGKIKAARETTTHDALFDCMKCGVQIRISFCTATKAVEKFRKATRLSQLIDRNKIIEMQLKDKEGLQAEIQGYQDVMEAEHELREKAEAEIETLREITKVKDPEQHFEQIMSANKQLQAEIDRLKKGYDNLSKSFVAVETERDVLQFELTELQKSHDNLMTLMEEGEI